MNTGQTDLLAALQEFEQQISPRRYADKEGNWFKCLQGKRPVVVSAPHSCCHLRDGVEKMAEEYTAAIVCVLAHHVGCHAIYATNKTAEDPNWVRLGAYKKTLQKIVEDNRIEFLIDLHGMTNRHHMGLALGTMSGQSCPAVDLQQPFLKEGFVLTDSAELPPKITGHGVGPIGVNEGAGENENWRRLIIDHPRFTGGLKSHTVTRFAVEDLGINAVQVEIASVARIVDQPRTVDWPYDYQGDPQAILACVNALCALASVYQ